MNKTLNDVAVWINDGKTYRPRAYYKRVYGYSLPQFLHMERLGILRPIHNYSEQGKGHIFYEDEIATKHLAARKQTEYELSQGYISTDDARKLIPGLIRGRCVFPSKKKKVNLAEEL